MSILAVMLLTAGAAGAVPERGLVTGVYDGDTIVLVAGETELTVDLAEIDAPELEQAFGELARAALTELVLQREVVISSWAADGRARISVADTDVSRELLARGLAWSDSQVEELVVASMIARTQKAGLWEQPDPMPPRVWRERAAEAAAAAEPKPASTATLGDIGAQVRLRADGDKIVIGNEIRRIKPGEDAAGGGASGGGGGDPCAELYDFIYGIQVEMAEAFAEEMGAEGTVTSNIPGRSEFLSHCRSLPRDIQNCLSLSSLMTNDAECREKIENAPSAVHSTFEKMGMNVRR